MRGLLRLLLVVSSLSARGALAHGDLHQQIEQVSQALKQTPQDAALWHKRGELFRAHHDFTHALADYAHAQALDPKLEVVHLSRGRVLYEAERLRPAERSLSRFLQNAPGHVEALLLRARTFAGLGQLSEAEHDFASALRSSDDPLPDLFLERALNLSRAGKPEAALSVLEQGKVRLGPLVTLDDAALVIELRTKRFPQALSRIDAMLSRAARREHLLAQKAKILDAAGDRAAAREVRLLALLQIEALPELKRKLDSTKKLTRELQSGLAQAEPAARRR